MEIINYKYLQSINIIFKYIIIFDIKDIIHNEVGGKSPPTLIPTDCSVLRTPTILPNIRISREGLDLLTLVSYNIKKEK